MASTDDRDPIEDFEHLQRELHEYDPRLADKPFLVVGNKSDEESASNNIERFNDRFEQMNPLFISAVLEDGLDDLRSELLKKLS